MNITIINKLPPTEEIIQTCPLSDTGSEKVAEDKKEVSDIIAGKDNRMLVIIGPCSAWPYEAVIEYAKRLKNAEKKLREKLKIIMRVYIQKPRTNKGWTGPVNQPNPFAPPNIAEGIKFSRKLMVEIIEMGLPIADEAVFTHNAKGFIELLSWVAIGARSTEDQEHRIFASAVDCPVGMKNPTSGSIEAGVNGVIAAQSGHIAVFHGAQVETHGNQFAHLVLRGGADRSNYHADDMFKAKKLLEKSGVKNPAVLIDASHDNCKIDGIKDPIQQINVTNEVLATLKLYPDIRKLVKGFMFESFLKSGGQKIDGKALSDIDMEGLSITDPCLGWKESETLLNTISNNL